LIGKLSEDEEEFYRDILIAKRNFKRRRGSGSKEAYLIIPG